MERRGICYIICAGERSPLDIAKGEDDLVIAADGGAGYLQEVGMVPDVALGDFDSYGRVPDAREVVRLDPIKDVTDTYAAAELALERGYLKIDIRCALGGRLSHTLANIQTLAMLSERGADARITGNGTVITVVKGEATFGEGGYLSLFPLDGDAVAEIMGCKYSGTFRFTHEDSLGVSNEPGRGARVKMLSGRLLAIAEER